MINTIGFDGDDVLLLDQNRLPGELVYERIPDHRDLAEAIKLLKVRGAPLIGVSAAFGLALAAVNYSGSADGLEAYYYEAEQLFAATRPTAVNLFGAIRRMRLVFDRRKNSDINSLAGCLRQEAQKMFDEDIAINHAIGEAGQELLAPESRVLTICNAGALATCGYGTALGVIRSADRRSKIKLVWACETRPVLQGARLTVWELMQDKIPVTLITDNMAAYLMNLQQIDAIIVGADRIAANGDTANKIGTYSLAVLAQYHKIPFYVAAPLSTVDIDILSGREIPIEERDQEEVRRILGNYITVPEVRVFNPAFDVTPADLIKAIITEVGVLRPPFGDSLIKLKKEMV